MPDRQATHISSEQRPTRVPWPPILLVGVIAAAVLLGRFVPLDWPGIDDPPAHIIGYGFGLAGLALAAWAAFELWRAGTTLRPDVGASVLVTTGPFWRWRNPIYLGEVLFMLGLAEATHNVWFVVAAAAFGLLVTWLAILPEERHLEARFGEAWRAYKERSKRWI